MLERSIVKANLGGAVKISPHSSAIYMESALIWTARFTTEGNCISDWPSLNSAVATVNTCSRMLNN